MMKQRDFPILRNPKDFLESGEDGLFKLVC